MNNLSIFLDEVVYYFETAKERIFGSQIIFARHWKGYAFEAVVKASLTGLQDIPNDSNVDAISAIPKTNIGLFKKILSIFNIENIKNIYISIKHLERDELYLGSIFENIVNLKKPHYILISKGEKQPLQVLLLHPEEEPLTTIVENINRFLYDKIKSKDLEKIYGIQNYEDKYNLEGKTLKDALFYLYVTSKIDKESPIWKNFKNFYKSKQIEYNVSETEDSLIRIAIKTQVDRGIRRVRYHAKIPASKISKFETKNNINFSRSREEMMELFKQLKESIQNLQNFADNDKLKKDKVVYVTKTYEPEKETREEYEKAVQSLIELGIGDVEKNIEEQINKSKIK